MRRLAAGVSTKGTNMKSFQVVVIVFLALVALFATGLLAQEPEKQFLLEYTVEEIKGNCGCATEGSNTVCAIPCHYGPAAVLKTKKFDRAQEALKWIQDGGEPSDPLAGYYDVTIPWIMEKPDRTPVFVSLYRLERVPVEVVTNTIKKERTIVDEETETILVLDGEEYRRDPDQGSGFSGSALILTDEEFDIINPEGEKQ